MKGKGVFRFTVLAALLLTTVCSSAFCQQAQASACKPKLLYEAITIPVLFNEGKFARLQASLLPCNICQQNEVNGSGTALAPPECDRTVHMQIAVRTVSGIIVRSLETDVQIGQTPLISFEFNPDDFDGVTDTQVIATVCVTDTSAYKKRTSCCGIVNASLIIFRVENSTFITDSVTPLVPLEFYKPATIRF